MVAGALAQLLTILKFTPETVPAKVSGPVAVEAVKVHGKPSNTGTPQSGLEPLTVAPVIEALATENIVRKVVGGAIGHEANQHHCRDIDHERDQGWVTRNSAALAGR